MRKITRGPGRNPPDSRQGLPEAGLPAGVRGKAGPGGARHLQPKAAMAQAQRGYLPLQPPGGQGPGPGTMWKRCWGPGTWCPCWGCTTTPSKFPGTPYPPNSWPSVPTAPTAGVVCGTRPSSAPGRPSASCASGSRRSWYWFGREPVYLGIRPQVMVEKYLGLAGQPPMDYKVMCFNGEPRVVQVHQKVAGGHAITFYDVDGERLGLGKGGLSHHRAQAPGGGPAETAVARRPQAGPVGGHALSAHGLLLAARASAVLRAHLFRFLRLQGLHPGGSGPVAGQAAAAGPHDLPQVRRQMKWRTIMGSRWCDKVERYDQCPSCGHERRVDMESSS